MLHFPKEAVGTDYSVSTAHDLKNIIYIEESMSREL